MKAKKNKHERERGNYVGQHLKDSKRATVIQYHVIGKRSDNGVIVGRLGGGMDFSMKMEQLRRALGERREGQYDK